VAANGEPILSNDALNDTRGHTIEGTDDIEESMLVVPMLFEGRSVGVIALSKLGNNQFSNDDLQTMTIFAGYAAQAMANAGAYERLELQSAELARQLQSQRRLLEINERLLSTLDRADVLETIADGLKAVVRYDNLSIYGVDEAQRVLVPVLTRERHEEEVRRYIVPFGQGLMGWAVEHGESVLANDALTDPRAMQIPGTPDDPEALVVVPLMADGDVIGCMNISRIGGPEVHFSDADFELVKLFAGQASIALRNADAHQAIAMRAETDALTGLGNHGAFQRTLADVLRQPEAGTEAHRRRAAPPAGPVALLMMDLDNFKAYNDRLGHPAGDALLHAIGAAIYGSARGEDRVFRYGGDEFAVLLPDVDARAAEAIGERVRQAVARLTAKEAARVTITVGVAAYPEDAVDKNDLIAAADIALYLGKQSGEDRVVRADEVPNEMRDLRSTLDRLARAALLHPDDAPTVDSLVEQAALLSHATEGGQDTVRGALLGVARSLDALDPAAIGHGERVGRLAGRVARKLGCDENAADTVELAACRGWRASAPTSWSQSRPCARSARSCAGIGPAARSSGCRSARRCWRRQTRTTAWLPPRTVPRPIGARPSTSWPPRQASATAPTWCTRWRRWSASGGGPLAAGGPATTKRGSAGRPDERRDAMIAPLYVEPHPRRRAPGTIPPGRRDPAGDGGADGMRHDQPEPVGQRIGRRVGVRRCGERIGPAQPAAADAAAHAHVHQPAGPRASGADSHPPARREHRGAADQRVRHDAGRLCLRVR
jgi:diguanylate cyclase (GGDEF)-like protein